MDLYSRILVATDFSAAALAATRIAATLAARLDAAVTLAHVYDSTPLGLAWPGDDSKATELARAAHKQLEQIRDDHLGGRAKVDLVTVDAESGALAVCELAGQRRADLIVVGTHGRTGLARLIIGSVADTVVRHAPCDVLTIPPQTAESWQPKRLLVATDFSDAAKRALARTADLARKLSASVVVLHSYDASVPVPASDGHDGPFMPLEDLEQALQSDLNSTAAKLRGIGKVTTALVVGDSVAEGIATYAREHQLALIVVASHGLRGLTRFLLGSVAEKVVRAAPCPVLTVRAPRQDPSAS